MIYFIFVAVVLWLAYGNGANDNFKGVATLYGSGAASYRRALIWASAATLAGSLISLLLAKHLTTVFSGAGLLPDELLGSNQVLIATGAGAAVTIALATALGMPTSTTHALAGALLGIAWATSSLATPLPVFLKVFALPLLLSPFMAIALTAVVYPVLHKVRLAYGITRDSCLCVDEIPFVVQQPVRSAALASTATSQLRLGTVQECRERYDGNIAGVDAETTVNAVHYLSGGAVCFSRAVNDTPKIAALLLASNTLHPALGLSLVAGAMLLGGLIRSRKVAETMSHRLTSLNVGQGLCANLITAGLVIGASRIGVPVSTTHVSCGSIFGIGLVQGSAQWRTTAAIAMTWLTTLPLAALIAAVTFRVSSSLGL